MGWGMGRTGMASRSLRDRDAMEKAAGLRPTTRWGAPFCFYLVAMGSTARLMPRLTHCSWPQTPLVGTSHTRHNTTWAVTLSFYFHGMGRDRGLRPICANLSRFPVKLRHGTDDSHRIDSTNLIFWPGINRSPGSSPFININRSILRLP